MMNPITSLPAAEFLLLYGMLIALIVALAAAYLWAGDPTRYLIPQVQGRIDPYEVAYLRGGQNELARVVMVSLVERGLLECGSAKGLLSSVLGSTKYITQTTKRPGPGSLSTLEQEVYGWFADRRSVGEVFSDELPARLGSFCLPLEERLQQQQLLQGDDEAPRWHVIAPGILVISAIALARIVVALQRGRPFGFLIAMCVVGVVVLLLASKRRLTALGRAYLAQLRSHLRPEAGGPEGMDYAFAAAVAGTAALANTPLADLGTEFKKGEQEATAACGGDGGDGGGGCGGCGGCGG